MLRLNDRRRYGGGNVVCDLCGSGKEDLAHFIMKCNILDGKRKNSLLEGEESDVVRLGGLLFSTRKETVEELKKMLGEMWRERKRLRDLLGEGDDMGTENEDDVEGLEEPLGQGNGG